MLNLKLQPGLKDFNYFLKFSCLAEVLPYDRFKYPRRSAVFHVNYRTLVELSSKRDA